MDAGPLPAVPFLAFLDLPMGFWKRLFKDDSSTKVDYYDEGLQLLKSGKYHEALTSLRLALRAAPSDPAILQQMAIAYTRIGMTDEAMRTYRAVLSQDAAAPGAHYGLAFLLLRDGERAGAVDHLRAFLAAPPQGPEALEHIAHAQQTLADLTDAAES